MRRLPLVALYVWFMLFLTISGVILLMRIQPPDQQVIAQVQASDTHLRVGDYMLVLGTPTSRDAECSSSSGYTFKVSGPCYTVDLWFGKIEVDPDARNFSPFSPVQYANEDNSPTGLPWKGFRTP